MASHPDSCPQRSGAGASGQRSRSCLQVRGLGGVGPLAGIVHGRSPGSLCDAPTSADHHAGTDNVGTKAGQGVQSGGSAGSGSIRPHRKALRGRSRSGPGWKESGFIAPYRAQGERGASLLGCYQPCGEYSRTPYCPGRRCADDRIDCGGHLSGAGQGGSGLRDRADICEGGSVQRVEHRSSLRETPRSSSQLEDGLWH